nr:BTB/POZ domain-containing protein At3g22104 [Ipomoea batatas]
MDVPCDLEMDVNGEEVFMVNKNVLSFYCGRIRKLFSKSKGRGSNVKVIFHDFPGGAESFELIARFCYNKGNISVNPFNVSALYCGAHFMEMDKCDFGSQNLVDKMEKSLKDIRYWTWSELVVALRQCQNLVPVASSSGMLDRYLDSLIGRVASSCEASPCPSASSPESGGFRLSCDTRSTESLRTSIFRTTTWWFDDLASFEPFLFEMLIKQMVSKNFDHIVLSKFIFYYQKTKFAAATTTGEKSKIMETVIEMLYLLDLSAVPCKNLFVMLRVSVHLNMSKCCRNKLQSMIGSQLDQATLDNLLLPSPLGTSYLYDVNSVLKFLKSFLSRGACSVPLTRLKKVAHLMDLYVAEVAPDPRLKPAKFLALIRSLPDSARDSHDRIYHAMDMYLEVHSGLPEEEKMTICCELNYEKLSTEARNHLAQNNKFPSKSAVQALISQQSKLKSLLQKTNQDSPCRFQRTESLKKDDQGCEQIVLYARKLDLSTQNDNLRAHLQGMQWRVMELERVCRKMQIQMTKIMKSRLTSQTNPRSLPRLCS